MYLFPYKMGSQGAKELAKALGIKRLKREGSKFRGTPDKVVVNWGNGGRLPDQIAVCQVLNKPEAVNKAGNKLLAFNAMNAWNEAGDVEENNVNIPEYTEDKEVADGWAENGLVVSRTVLRGHSGAGICIGGGGVPVEPAPLYVKYVKKTQEYRVHMLKGNVIDQQRKARNKGVADDDVNWQVRNHDNGFIFMREGVALPDVALDQARFALDALGLDFGAVDLIYNEHENKYYVLEVNTAPGLTGTTLEKYTEAFNAIA